MGKQFGTKQGLLVAGKLVLVFIAMIVAFVIGQMIADGVLGPLNMQLSREESSQSGLALLIVALMNSAVLSYLILGSRLRGVQLIAAIFVIHFGVETFMSQIETVFFGSSFAITPVDMARIIGSGLVRALVFAPLAVFILGKASGNPETAELKGLFERPVVAWVKPVAIIALGYVCIYFLFGYFVAWQWPETRQFYSGSTEIKPFINHMLDTLLGNPALVLFQIVRGLMWAGLALLIIGMWKASDYRLYLAVSVVLAVLLASGVVFPNPLMPFAVRQSHMFELSSSMLVFGWIAAYMLTRRSALGATLVGNPRPNAP